MFLSANYLIEIGIEQIPAIRYITKPQNSVSQEHLARVEGGRFSGIVKREVVVSALHEYTNGRYGIRKSLLLAWSMSVDV